MTSKIRRGLPALFTIVLLATVTFGQDPNSGAPALQCAAPAKYVNTFQNAKCVEVTLRYDLKLTRVFSNDNARLGTYFTTTCLMSPRYAIRKLALKQEWGNRATKIVEVTVPAGTTIYIGIAAFQDPETLYPGGAQQTVVVDISKLVWGTPRRFISERCGSGELERATGFEPAAKIEDPWLPELVRGVEAGQSITDTIEVLEKAADQ